MLVSLFQHLVHERPLLFVGVCRVVKSDMKLAEDRDLNGVSLDGCVDICV